MIRETVPSGRRRGDDDVGPRLKEAIANTRERIDSAFHDGGKFPATLKPKDVATPDRG